MDFTETYIKICDCPEIQGEWKPSGGDWYIYHYDPYPEDDPARGGYVEEILKVVNGQDVRNFPKDKGDYTWLPRQDQIQEMIKSKSDIWVHKHNRFSKYLINEIEKNHAWAWEIADSQEKAWLAFYMHEQHGLKWLIERQKWGNK